MNDQTKGGIWYLAHRAKEYETGKAAVLPHIAIADLYQIDSTIAPNNEISGTTVMRFTCKLPGRVLPLSLARKLRIETVDVSPAGGRRRGRRFHSFRRPRTRMP